MLFVLLRLGSLPLSVVALRVGSSLVLREGFCLRSRRALLFQLLACVAAFGRQLLRVDWLAMLVHGDLDGWKIHLLSGQG